MSIDNKKLVCVKISENFFFPENILYSEASSVEKEKGACSSRLVLIVGPNFQDGSTANKNKTDLQWHGRGEEKEYL